MAATYDSAYLLKVFNRLTGRPATGDAITDALKYERLSEAQNEIVADMAPIVPSALYPTVATASLPTMTVSAAGDIATFGTDANGYSISPIGKTTLYRSLADFPTIPMVGGVDFVQAGATTIRALNGATLPSTIYWVGITNPADIDATHQPALFPEASRELIAIRAAYNFASEGLRNPNLMAAMAARYGRPLTTEPNLFATWCLTWKTQYRQGGALAALTGMQAAVAGASPSM